MSKIEWTEATWNPIAGCTVHSPGCTNCYAMRTAARLARIPATASTYAGLTQPSKAGPVWTGKIEVNETAMLAPLKRKKPTMYFVNSMSDLFHESVPDDVIDRVFAVMALCPQHTFQVLTKRSARMRAYFSVDHARAINVSDEIQELAAGGWQRPDAPSHNLLGPLPNVWLGVSVEDQKRADERIPDLLATPAAVRFLSCEPLLGPLDLGDVAGHQSHVEGIPVDAKITLNFNCLSADNLWHYRSILRRYTEVGVQRQTSIDWVIVGGESGPGARPMHPDWARSLRDQCAAAGVPFFFKQWGEWAPHPTGEPVTIRQYHESISYIDRDTGARKRNPNRTSDHTMRRIGKKAAGRTLDGIIHDFMPLGGSNA